MPATRIVIGTSNFAEYSGGGHWSWVLQYPLGLKALKHDVFWLELYFSHGQAEVDRAKIAAFLERADRYGFGGRAAVLEFPAGAVQELDAARVQGLSKSRIDEVVASADLLWNFACAYRNPLLARFKHPVLLDGDPGHLQVCVEEFDDDMDVFSHKTFLTVGDTTGSQMPTLGLEWHSCLPIVYLPWWPQQPDPGPGAPFSTITHWTWEELWLKDRKLSVSKRDGYLRYLELPKRARRPFHLAAHLVEDDRTGDRELLEANGWVLIDPRVTVATPELYHDFIVNSRAEILCPKPVYRIFNTGWLSDRSACYLASGRPVLAEETGFSRRVPVGEGLLSFNNMEAALTGVENIDRNYARHRQAARALAEEYFATSIGLPRMLAACGV